MYLMDNFRFIHLVSLLAGGTVIPRWRWEMHIPLDQASMGALTFMPVAEADIQM